MYFCSYFILFLYPLFHSNFSILFISLLPHSNLALHFLNLFPLHFLAEFLSPLLPVHSLSSLSFHVSLWFSLLVYSTNSRYFHTLLSLRLPHFISSVYFSFYYLIFILSLNLLSHYTVYLLSHYTFYLSEVTNDKM